MIERRAVQGDDFIGIVLAGQMGYTVNSVFLFWLAPNPLLNSLAALPIKVPFHSIIGNRGIDEGANSSDGIVDYESSHLEGAESEKIILAGHNLVSNPATVAEIQRILGQNIVEGISDRNETSNQNPFIKNQ